LKNWFNGRVPLGDAKSYIQIFQALKFCSRLPPKDRAHDYERSEKNGRNRTNEKEAGRFIKKQQQQQKRLGPWGQSGRNRTTHLRSRRLLPKRARQQPTKPQLGVEASLQVHRVDFMATRI
jgi:hypothetical protein